MMQTTMPSPVLARLRRLARPLAWLGAALLAAQAHAAGPAAAPQRVALETSAGAS